MNSGCSVLIIWIKKKRNFTPQKFKDLYKGIDTTLKKNMGKFRIFFVNSEICTINPHAFCHYGEFLTSFLQR